MFKHMYSINESMQWNLQNIYILKFQNWLLFYLQQTQIIFALKCKSYEQVNLCYLVLIKNKYVIWINQMCWNKTESDLRVYLHIEFRDKSIQSGMNLLIY